MNDFLMWAGGIVISLGAAVTGWVFKMVFDAIKEQRNDHDKAVKESRDEQKRIDRSIMEHKLHASETFATKADVQSGFREIILKLDNMSVKFDSFAEKIEEKLAKKVDKV